MGRMKTMRPSRFFLMIACAFIVGCCWIAVQAAEDSSHASTTSDHASSGSSSETTSHQDDDGSHASSHASSHSSSHSSSHAPSVFVLGEYFDYKYFIILLSIVGGCAVVLELILTKYEEYLKCDGDKFQSTLLEKIMRELLTLGVVSFLLYLLEPVVTHGTLFYIFEFTHYVIFFIAIFTVLQLVMLGASTYPIKAAWDRAAFKSKDEILKGYRFTVASRGWAFRVPLLGRVSLDVMHVGPEWVWIDCIEYHLARSVFIRQFGRSVDFDFARYARLVTDRMILTLANPPLRSWTMLIVLHWIAYPIKVALGHGSSRVGYEFWFVFGLILLGCEVALLYACMLGMRRIAVKLGADPQNATGTMDTVLEKVWVAPRTTMEHSRITRTSILRSSLDEATLAADQGDRVVRSTSTEEKTSSEDNNSVDPKAEEVEVTGGLEVQSGSVENNVPTIDLKDAFLVSSTKVHRYTIEALMMLNSYYLAFYAVYFIGSASNSSTNWFWIILLPLPILCGTLMAYRRVLPLYALLSALAVLQTTDVADVEQEAEELDKLRRNLVLRVQHVLEQEIQACNRLGDKPPDEASACVLLSRWDEDRSGKLSYDELERGLAEIGLLLSRRQRRELFRLADPDRSGCVDVVELAELLYDVEVSVAADAAVA